MNFRGGFSIPQPDEFNFDGLWIPANPEPNRRLGLENWAQQVAPNYNELAQIFNNANSQVVGPVQQQTFPGNCGGGGGGGDSDWNNMPLMQLLLQSNDSNFAVSRDSRIRPPMTLNSSLGHNLSFGPEFADAYCRIEQRQQIQSLGSVPQISFQYDYATPSKPSYDLNLSPAMNPNHFTPVTPDPVPTHQSSGILVQSSGDGPIQQSFTQLLQNIVESSSSSSTLVPTPVEEKDGSEKRTELVIDLNETPQQKPPKRRKHRPKVVREGKPKRTPKEKTEPNGENRPAKRKYVRKNISQDSNAATEEAQRSCKRALNFDLEEIPPETETETETGNGNRSNITIDLRGSEHNNGTRMVPNEIGVSVNQAPNGQSGNRQTAVGPLGLVGVQGKGFERSNPVEEVNPAELQMIKELMQSAFQQIPKTPSKSGEARGSKRDHSHLSTTNHVGELRKTDHSTSGAEKQVAEARSAHRVNLIAHSLKQTSNMGTCLEKTGLSERRNNSVHYVASVHSSPNLHIANTHSLKGTMGCISVHNPLVNFSGQGNGQMFQITQTVPDLARVSKPQQQAPKKRGPKKKNSFPATIDEIIYRLRTLSLEGSGGGLQENDRNALVLYKGGGTLVPYQGVDAVKKRKPRPKVDLDSETNRIWNLLMGKEGIENVEENDVKKEKWWEEERKVFHGRVDSFIARMHLVQGDRRFSRWKGSVVDSVIGVFLTQNVSDHLSSSAFMSMAARFPLKPRTQEEANTNIIDIEAPIAAINPDEAIKWYEAPTEPTKIPEEEYILSQDSFDSSITQLAGGIRSCSGSNSETEDPFARLKPGTGQVSPLTDYLSAQKKSSSVQEVCSQEKGYLSSTSQISELWLSEKASQIPEALSKGSRAGEDSGSFGLWWSHETPETIDPFAFLGLKTSNQLEIPLAGPDTGYSRSSIQPGNLAESLDGTKKVALAGVNDFVGKIAEAGDCSSAVNTQIQIEVLPKTKNSKPRKGKSESEKKSAVDWDELRKKAESNGKKKERTRESMDSLDYEAVRTANVKEISDCIKERGMNNMLAERMKEFLNRMVRDHGSIDLEWLRDVPPDKAKDYLLSVRGLGLKSVECVRLLTLHHLAFPVDTNVGRIAVRLGWVPLQPLPESLQLHLLELYPILESIQKYLWPRLCKLDQRTLYELHYQMITFGKVFCTKSKPNCNACPMRGECRHFASAFASARLALPGPEERSIVTSNVPQTAEDNNNNNYNKNNNNNNNNPGVIIHPMSLPPPETNSSVIEVGSCSRTCEPIIEEPATPEQECLEILESDIEDFEDPNEIPTIKLNISEFKENLQNYMQNNMELQEADMSKALVALNPDVASIPIPKLKNISRLRTEHQVYELPDSHPLLERLQQREADDPSPYLLAIWTPGETASSIQPPEKSCGSEPDKLCGDATCFSCNSVRETNTQTVRGTILIPCRTAMRGSFPLNGTYFQVNEMFAEHESSLNPINVPREWIWNLPRRMVYFGTSVSTIFKGLTTEGIQYCFWRGFVCVRGFDLVTRAPRPLMARLHFPASKLAKAKSDEKK